MVGRPRPARPTAPFIKAEYQRRSNLNLFFSLLKDSVPMSTREGVRDIKSAEWVALRSLILGYYTTTFFFAVVRFCRFVWQRISEQLEGNVRYRLSR